MAPTPPPYYDTFTKCLPLFIVFFFSADQFHYDWGLRAVKSVLLVAGKLKRCDPHIDEEAVLMRALRDFNTPKIVSADTPIFLRLIADLFPSMDLAPKVSNVGSGMTVAPLSLPPLEPWGSWTTKRSVNTKDSVQFIYNRSIAASLVTQFSQIVWPNDKNNSVSNCVGTCYRTPLQIEGERGAVQDLHPGMRRGAVATG